MHLQDILDAFPNGTSVESGNLHRFVQGYQVRALPLVCTTTPIWWRVLPHHSFALPAPLAGHCRKQSFHFK